MGEVKEIRNSKQQLREEWAKNRPERDHMDDAGYFHAVHTDGRLDSTENPELLSVTIEYFESVEDAKAGNSKKLRLWAYKDSADAYGRELIRASECRTLPDGW
jgi:hypothetical protein